MNDFEKMYDIEWEIPQNSRNILQKEASLYLFAKRVVDILCSLIGLVLLSPLLLAVTVAIKLSSKGNVIYKQKRVGFGGSAFTIYKFRTMVIGAEKLEQFLSQEMLELYNTNRKLNKDPRITKIGEFLRKTSIDELPQLLNILKGDMSIVGPRPIMLDEIDMYGDNYEQYITVKPGLTGLWQIQSRDNTLMSARSELDLEYIQNKSFTYDNEIVLRTIKVVLTRKGAC